MTNQQIQNSAVINLLPLERIAPDSINEVQYNQLISRKKNGWSNCEDRMEWLCKLHYLQTGYATAKIDLATFLQKEEQLVISWWAKDL